MYVCIVMYVSYGSTVYMYEVLRNHATSQLDTYVLIYDALSSKENGTHTNQPEGNCCSSSLLCGFAVRYNRCTSTLIHIFDASQ